MGEEFGTKSLKVFFGYDAALESSRNSDCQLYVVDINQRKRSNGEPIDESENHNLGYVVSKNSPTSEELLVALGGFNIYKI